MAQGARMLFGVIGIAVMTYVLTVLLNFLGIGIQSYGSYLAWAVALGVFYIVLPKRGGHAFNAPSI
jgi:hypothetical protein